MFWLIEPSSGIWLVYIYLYLFVKIPTLVRHFTHNMMLKYNICVTLVLSASFRAEDIVSKSEFFHMWKLLKSAYTHWTLLLQNRDLLHRNRNSGISKHEACPLNFEIIQLLVEQTFVYIYLYRWSTINGHLRTPVEQFICFFTETMKWDRLFHTLKYVHFSINKTESDETDETCDSLWKTTTFSICSMIYVVLFQSNWTLEHW
jgi:hypothetical protein